MYIYIYTHILSINKHVDNNKTEITEAKILSTASNGAINMNHRYKKRERERERETSITYTRQSNVTSSNSQNHRRQPTQPKWHLHTFHLCVVFCTFSSFGVQGEA